MPLQSDAHKRNNEANSKWSPHRTSCRCCCFIQDISQYQTISSVVGWSFVVFFLRNNHYNTINLHSIYNWYPLLRSGWCPCHLVEMQMIREMVALFFFEDCCGCSVLILWDGAVGEPLLLLRNATLSNKSARHNKIHKRTYNWTEQRQSLELKVYIWNA